MTSIATPVAPSAAPSVASSIASSVTIPVSIPVRSSSFVPAAAELKPVRTAGALSLCLTRNCNLSCTHCSVEALNGRKPSIMDIGIARQALETFVRPAQREHFRIVFFGGEPMLAPLAWFEEFHGMLADYPATRFALGMQTNGTIMGERHIEFARRTGMQLSISLDGQPEINDVLRERGNKVVTNIRKLVDAGLPPKIVVVIAPHNHDKVRDTLDFLQGLGVSGVRFNTLFEVGRATEGDSLTDQQLLAAKQELIRHELANDGSQLSDVMTLRMLTDYARHQLRAQPGQRNDCTGYTCHAGFTYFSIDPQGDVFPCSDMTFTMHEFRLGNVLDQGFDPQHVTRTLGRFHAKGEWWDRCQGCAASTICDFGCPALTPTAAHTGNPHCEVTKMLWTFLEANRDAVMQWYDRQG